MSCFIFYQWTICAMIYFRQRRWLMHHFVIGIHTRTFYGAVWEAVFADSLCATHYSVFYSYTILCFIQVFSLERLVVVLDENADLLLSP